MTVYAIFDSDFEQVGKAFKNESDAREAFIEFLDRRIPSYGFGNWEYYADIYGFGKDVESFKYAMTQYGDYDDDFEYLGRIIAIDIED